MTIAVGIYADHVLPRVLDFAMSRPQVLQERALALAEAHGEVLEIGFGTALNLAYYPSAVERLTVVDPADVLRKRVARRIAAAPMAVEIVHTDAAQLPLDAGQFDCVVTTWTLCTIPDVASALREIARVLKPQGWYLFLEHGRSSNPKVARWQDRLNPIQRVVSCGCNLNRPIDNLIARAGLQITRLERYDMPKTPSIFAPHYRGRATVC
ncbi:MAG: class I SAM-dependent methyltransferase [Pirellulales bacterium]